jgi:hypothetical protein
MRPPFAAVLLLPALLACQSAPKGPPCSGAVCCTCAGAAAPPAYASGVEARAAFTRKSGTLTATLEDASWLRFTGAPDQVEERHRAYFEYGYTTFQVELHSDAFSQPSRETFVLEDSTGRRVTGQPIQFTTAPILVEGHYYAAFSLSFSHVITSDLAWIRLTRAMDGSTVEWTLSGPPAPSAGT